MSRYRVEIASRVAKELADLPKGVRLRIAMAIDALADDPRPPGAKKLTGHDAYRVRVGDYRILYEIADNVLVVLVVKVRHRKDVYR